MPLITDAVGRVLSGRYRLISPLGAGASAQVFLAEDVSLRRHVAIKVLQPALANDAGFLKRFRAEARSAAALNHPHIARVFDWGEDADGPYLVLEYLSGGSLLDLLERGVRLSVAQAASVASQAARGLAHAHARGLVHRDVKPANLLFDDEGRVRVADFGVARALAEGAFTEPPGAVGTARYAAPEQGQGLVLDGRADVYSLALVTFESLTGYVPFVLDTAIGTLAARIGAVLPGHGALGPLQPILRDAAAPDLNARPDAVGLAQRLEALSATLPRPQPLPLSAPRRLVEGPPTLAGVPGAAGAATGVMDQTGVVRPTRVAAGPDQVFDFESAEDAGRTRTGRRRRWPLLVVLGVVLALIAGGLLAALQKGVFTPTHAVPTVTGLSLDQARTSLAKDHFVLSDHGTTTSITVGPGKVVRQDPVAGTTLKQGSTVSVIVSRGLPVEHIPSLLGLGCNGATRLLKVNHLNGACPNAAAAYSNSVPVGQVINWSYNDKLNATTAPYGSTVLMALSLGPAPVPIPNVQGDSPQQAETILQQAGFQVTETSAPSATTKSGQVDHTNPPAGTPVQKGTTVTIFVSSGPPTVQVPNESGKSVSAAEADLQNKGLKTGSVFGPAGGTVFASVPEPGQTVQQGSSVNLYTA
jgi:eukaryotic-like serine/threonine-protein kinase